MGCYQKGEDHGLQRTHVVTDKNRRALQVPEMLDPVDMKHPPGAFQQTKILQRGCCPSLNIVKSIEAGPSRPDYHFRKIPFETKRQARNEAIKAISLHPQGGVVLVVYYQADFQSVFRFYERN
jgi:hypothetical protein